MLTNPRSNPGPMGWSFQGTHELSALEVNTGGGLGGYNSSRGLRLRATGRGANRLRAELDTALGTNTTNTISARARWLRGETNLVLRMHGNWLEAAGTLIVPTNLGSPGLINSRFLTNTGPAIFEVAHVPALPQYGQNVRVSARVHDPDGVTNIVLRYRIDPSATLTSATMNDGGTNGDLIAGDGLFSAPIPAEAAGVIAAFRVEAADAFGVTNRFPAASVWCALANHPLPAALGLTASG